LYLLLKCKEEKAWLKLDAVVLARILTKMAESVGHVETIDILDDIDRLLDEEKFDEVIKKSNEFLLDSSEEDDRKAMAYLYLAKGFVGLRDEVDSQIEDSPNVNVSLLKEHKKYTDKALSAYDNALGLSISDDYRYYIYSCKGDVADKAELSRDCYIEAMQSSDHDVSDEAKENYVFATNDLFSKFEDESFSEMFDYRERKFLFVVNSEKQLPGCFDKEGNIKWVFTINKIPSNIIFPMGHPLPNTLYIGHPLKPNEYLPFENATEQLFMEKVRELCYLAQCLGATEISFKKIKGLNISSSQSKELNASGTLGRKFATVSGERNFQQESSEEQGFKDGHELVQRYSPVKMPFCPDDLIWLDTDNTWKTLVKQRLNGNILSYTEKVTSYETITLTSNQLLAVKGSFEYLLVKASGSCDIKSDKTFSKTEETEWQIDMRFKPLQEFSQTNTPQIAHDTTPNTGGDNLLDMEKAYLEEIEFCLEDDGVIDEQERTMLERKRMKLGISKERAKEIEDMAVSSNDDSLTEEEFAYKEEVEFCLEESKEIDSQARKFLERKRLKLGLTKEQAEKIESMLMNSNEYTDDEKEYLEILDDVIVEGVIPDSARRLLSREIKSLGITEERAKKLESLKMKGNSD
ncbi:MAG: hypothetical protein Q4D41_12355, partial [Prevotellaceae bacterium]|nr:hypothetical protein [Prevotellaceae bacterium]